MWKPLILSACLAGPALAEDASPLDEGMRMLSEGTRLLLEGLMEEAGPALDELREALEDLNAYEVPEVLPNGDIIIRRKPEAPPLQDPPDGPIDL